MKKLVLLLFLSIITFSSESIKNFNMDVEALSNGVLNVNEKIVYRTDEYGKHGIYRIMPYKYSNGSYFKFEDRIKFDNFKVTDENGVDIPVVEEYEKNVVSLRIGSERKLIEPNKDYTFNISYRIYNIIRKKNNIVQIYLNALGNYWEMPVENFNLKISGINGNIDIYTGFLGQQNKDYTISQSNGEYIISTNKVYSPGEGLSFILNSTDFNYTSNDMWLNRIHAYTALFILPIIICILGIINLLIYIYRNKNRVKDSIVIEYLPPKVSPVIAKKILFSEINGLSNYKNTLVVLFQLIDKNIVSFKERNPIHENEEYVRKVGQTYNKKVKNFEDYVEKQYYVNTDIANKYLNENLLSDEEKISLNKLLLVKNDIFKNSKVIYELEQNLTTYVNKKYSDNYAKRIYRYLLILILPVIVISILTVIYLDTEPIPVSISIILLILSIINSFNVYKYTSLYKSDYLKAKGFYKFLSTVEKEKFGYFNNIDDIVSYFRKILPYALAFGLENKYLRLLDSVIDDYGFDRELVYGRTNYYHIINRAYYYNMINDLLIRETKARNKNNYGGKSSFSGGFSSTGSSGGGFSGGGGHSW